MKTINKQLHKNRYRNNGCALAALGLALAGTHPAPACAVWGNASQETPTKTVQSKTDQTLDQTLRDARRTGWTAAIVKTTGPITAAQQATLTKLGADITRRLPMIQSVAVTVPTRNLGKLTALPFVSHLSADGQVKKCDEFTVASSGADTAFQQYGLNGSGITVAVIDSGIAPSDDLTLGSPANRLQGAVSFVPGDTNPNDACGHGSHVAGIIAGNGSHSTGAYRGYAYTHTYYGIARNTNLVNVRVLDKNGSSSVSTVLAGLQWAVQNKAKYNIRVINLSLGHPVGESYTTDPLCQAVEAAYRAGIVVVCAAGNAGRISNTATVGQSNEGFGTAYGSIQSPANDPYVITVGATKTTDGSRAHDKVATYSSRGPSRLDLVLKPDILAPGNLVISVNADGSTLDNYNGGTNDISYAVYCKSGSTLPSGKYFRLSGTSMAAPVVAGAAALLLQANPKLTPDTVKARLMISADKWAAPDAKGNATGQADPCTYGAGYLDIPAALKNTVTASQPALSPTLTEDAKGNVSISASGILSASHIIWGTGTVADLHIIWGTSAILGTSALSSTLSASHIIWGTSVFTNGTTWASSTGTVDLTSVAVSGEGAVVQTFQPNACPDQETAD